MSTLRLSLAVAVILAIGAPARLAQAQMFSGLNNGPHHGPFIEPDTFRPDFQFFAPSDATNYEVGNDVDPNRGFFFTYDRLYINVTRPDTTLPVFPPSTAPPANPFEFDRFSFVNITSSPWEGDFTWGNRVELGFIDCDDRGWTLVGWHVDGPNEINNIVNGDRLNGPAGDNDGSVNVDFTDPDGDNGTGQYDFQNISGPLLPQFGITSRTDLPIYTTTNEAKLGGVEIMRILERQTFHNGGVWEPMIGVRFIKFEDRFRYAFYRRSEHDADGSDDYELYQQQQSGYENNMLGGQLGARLFKETGHWKISSEVRLFALQNWQSFSSQADTYIWSSNDTFYDPTSILLRSPQYARQERVTTYDRNSEFCWGGELKMEAAYQISRDICFRTGFTFLDLGKGVGRGRDMTTNSQDVQMFGMNFGFTINK